MEGSEFIYPLWSWWKRYQEVKEWKKKGHPAPPPTIVKQRTVRQYTKQYGLDVLIETGTYLGEMVEATQNLFREIYSIELDKRLFENARNKFVPYKHIHVTQGDSSFALPRILRGISTPCLFWLDAHYSGGITAKGDRSTPIIREIQQIFSHWVDGHVILIDDARHFTGKNDYPTLDGLRSFVLSQHPEMQMVVKDDIIRLTSPRRPRHPWLSYLVARLTGGAVRIIANDLPPIHKLKKRFVHSEREFFYGTRRYITDSIYVHAAPGTVEMTILELVSLHKHLKSKRPRLLNLGGGTGQTSDLFHALGFEVFNVDIEVNEPNTYNIWFDLNSSRDLPFQKNFFDIVVCEEVVEHIENPWRLFRLIRKVLKDDGHLVMSTPNIASRYSRMLFERTGYFHWFTPDRLTFHKNPVPFWEIELIGRETGFRVTKILGNGEYYFRGTSVRISETIIRDNESLVFVLRKNKRNQ